MQVAGCPELGMPLEWEEPPIILRGVCRPPPPSPESDLNPFGHLIPNWSDSNVSVLKMCMVFNIYMSYSTTTSTQEM